MQSFAEIKKVEDRGQVATYKKMDLAIDRGSGSYVWTVEGDRYLDLYGGHAVCGTGHGHPRVVEAIKAQADKFLFYSNLVYSEIRGRAAEQLVAVAPHNLTKAFFCNSGTEANESAMRIARLATGRQKIVSFSGGFHGRTADSISSTFLGNYRKLGEPNVPHHVEAPFGDIDALASAIGDDTAAVIIEPIQSMAGVLEADPKYFSALRDACDAAGAVLIFDEVQTGMGRTGNWFFAGSPAAAGTLPDIITLAKSLGSGIPVGASVVSGELASKIKINDLGTTFGGGMIAMAAVLATLEVIESEGMNANALAIEKYVRDSVNDIPGIVGVRGKGCLLGIEFENGSSDAHGRLMRQKVITGISSDPNVLRLLPPLNVSKAEIDVFSEALRAE